MYHEQTHMQAPATEENHSLPDQSGLLVQVHLAEYAALRAEIVQLVSIEHACMGLAMTLVALAFGAKAVLLLGFSWVVVLSLCCVGLIYCDVGTRILRCAHYIDCELRIRLESVVKDERILGWEAYARGTHKHLERRGTLLGDFGATFQGLLFLVPATGFWAFGMTQLPTRPIQLMAYIVSFAALLWLGVVTLRMNRRKLQTIVTAS